MKNTFDLIFLLLILISCIIDSRRDGTKKIKDFSVGATQESSEDRLCRNYYLPTENTCHQKKCPKSSHQGTDEEIAKLKENFERQVEDGEFDEELVDEVRANFEHAKFVCIPGSGVFRPDKAVSIKSDLCACYNSSPMMVGNCSFYCSQLNLMEDKKDKGILYGRVSLGPEIELNEELGHLYGWCKNEISGSDYKGPDCKFVVQSADGTNYYLPITVRTNNSFTVDIDGLLKGKTYIGKIGETESGSGVFSNSVQFRLIDSPEEREIPEGPLKIIPISQYTCVIRPNSQYSPTLDEAHYSTALKSFYYMPAGTSPMPLDETHSNRGTQFCHDIDLYGPKDSPRYERLEYIPQHFALWDSSDIRFFDQNKNQSMDINEAVSQRLFRDFGIKENFKIFFPFKARPDPTVENDALLGYRMNFWIRPNSTKTFCPTQNDYFGENPIFNVLKDYVGIDTEGLYMALRETIALETKGEGQEISKAPPNIIYIRERELKGIWFVIEDGRHLRPDEKNLDSKTLMFYWPPDPYAPYTKKSDQKRYTVIYSTPSTEEEGETVASFRPSDKKIGCIPVSD